jgi:hypothetical protein
MGRADHHTELPPAWLRLESRTIEPDGMTLEFTATAAQDGRGQPMARFAELLAAGDLVRLSIRVGQPIEVTVQIAAVAVADEVRLGGGSGTPAAEVNSLGPPEVTQPPLPAVGDLYPDPGTDPVPEPADRYRCPADVPEREVALTQEVAPLEPAAEPRRMRGPDLKPRRMRGPGRSQGAPSDVAELRARIKHGEYAPFGELRTRLARGALK